MPTVQPGLVSLDSERGDLVPGTDFSDSEVNVTGYDTMPSVKTFVFSVGFFPCSDLDLL